jgi:hypothetical protein
MRIPGFSGDASIDSMSRQHGGVIEAVGVPRTRVVPALKSTTDCNWLDGSTVCCVTHNRYGVGTCCCGADVGCGCGYRSKFDGNFEP